MKSLLTVALLLLVAACIFIFLKSGHDQSEQKELKKLIQLGDVSGVSKLLKKNPYLIKSDLGGHHGDKIDPLSLSAGLGQESICSNLIAFGANVNGTNKHHETPLHRAVEPLNTNIVFLLLRNGADKNIKDRWGRTPLDIAKERKAPDTIIEALSSRQVPNPPSSH